MQTNTETPVSKGNGSANPVASTASKKVVDKSETKIMVECRHLSPLLMQAMPADVVEEVLVRKLKRPIKTDGPLEEMCLKSLYFDPEDGVTIGIPSGNLFACLREAGRKVKFEGKTMVSTAGTTQLPSFLQIDEEFLPITPNIWRPDVRRGQMDNGITVGIVRPKFKEWGFTATLTVDLTLVSEETVKQLFDIAGKRIGLCAFRPTKNGSFGRFKLTAFEVMTPKA